MQIPLLTTKLHIPPPRANLVSRPHLLDRLNASLWQGHPGESGFARKLTLISAPAGFGKTTLVSYWIADSGSLIGGKFCWLSLDEGDNDLARFLTYLIAAFQAVEPKVGETALAMLGSPQPPFEALLTDMINDLAGIPYPFILVLDDYHEIELHAIHETLTFLIERQPPQMHLVIASRADPPLSLARLRASGQLIELRQSDLRFSPEETAEFLTRVLRLDTRGKSSEIPPLQEEDVAALVARTEGWIAGLQLAAVSMQGRVDMADFVRAFTGSNRFILDYLLEEVLQRQSRYVQSFLLKTSILERMCAPLCDSILDDQPDSGDLGSLEDWRLGSREESPVPSLHAPFPSQQILEYLEQANLFVVPLDDQREWYRYHRLFVDLLRQRLGQKWPELAPDLHLQASVWFEQNGFIPEAIEHALEGADFKRAASLIEKAVDATLMRSEVATMLSWIEELPGEMVRTRPSLCFFHAWTLLMIGRPIGEVEARLKDVDIEARDIPARMAVLRAFIAISQARASLAAELSKQALEDLPEDDLYLRSVAAWILNMSSLFYGDLAESAKIIDEVIKVGRESGNIMVAVMALCHLAKLYERQGGLHEAKAIYQRAVELATSKEAGLLPIAGEALVGLGELSYHWNDLDGAVKYLLEGIELISQWRKVAALDGYVHLARARQAQGDADGACWAIQKAGELAVQFDLAEWDDLLVEVIQAELWVAQGNLEAAKRWVDDRVLDEDGEAMPLGEIGDLEGYHLRKYEYLIMARMLITLGQPKEALALLEPLLSRVEDQRRVGLMIQTLALMALAFRARGDLAQSMVSLERALALGEPEGYMRVFLDEGEKMGLLMSDFRSKVKGRARPFFEYIDRLLSAFGRATATPLHQPILIQQISIDNLVEPLSRREMQVLRLLAAGLSNPEIAQELYIATSTVRSHVKNIYSKLNVHKRWDAVERAKELKLL